MMKNNTILRASIILDLSKVGFEGKLFLFISTAKNYDSDQTIQYLKKMKHLYFVAELVGKYDIMVLAAIKNLIHLKEIINKIRSQLGVDRVDVAITDEAFFAFKNEYVEMPLF